MGQTDTANGAPFGAVGVAARHNATPSMSELDRLQIAANRMLADARLPSPSPDDLIAALADGEPVDPFPGDADIVDLYVENFGGTESEAIDRLSRFNAAEARANSNG